MNRKIQIRSHWYECSDVIKWIILGFCFRKYKYQYILHWISAKVHCVCLCAVIDFVRICLQCKLLNTWTTKGLVCLFDDRPFTIDLYSRTEHTHTVQVISISQYVYNVRLMFEHPFVVDATPSTPAFNFAESRTGRHIVVRCVRTWCTCGWCISKLVRLFGFFFLLSRKRIQTKKNE